ncbi:MAG: NADH-quinone oxidoreductase subunit H, partial [Myxococcales bacterium]|nr:NADH-quinone oxidoreductase subunit H [Myxococcales bacterium]
MTHVAAFLHRLAMATRRAPLRVLPLALLLGVLTAACGGEPPTATETAALVRIEPGELFFHPDTRPVEVTVVNVSERPITVGLPRVDEQSPDWVGFVVGEDAHAAPLQPGARASFHVGVDSAYFLGPGDHPPIALADGEEPEPVAADEYRPGLARLLVPVEGQPEPTSVAIRFEDPAWTTQYLLPALLKILLLVLGFIMPLASLLTWMERKQSAMMQDRVGPNRASIKLGPVNLRLWGIPHFVADAIKMLFKEDFIPRKAHRALYSLAPLFAFVPALVVFAIVPFGDALCYDRLFEPLSAADVAQCADGRGGTPLQIAQIDVGLLF